MEHIIANFGLKQAYIELFRGKNAVFTKEIWREQKDILFRGTSGIPQLNKVRKGLTG